MNGVLFIKKPKGWTSRDVVNRICKIYGTKKVGHTGTLDPLATGVLIVCLGSYTKLVSMLTSDEKEYVATMKVGVKTTTGDITGEVMEKQTTLVSEEKVRNAFQEFPKEYDQTVPLYSAVKVNGKKLYEYAREGMSVSLPKRKVEIKELEFLNRKEDEITFRCVVSKGTYIRSLIEDLASSFSSIATMKSLERRRLGNVSLKDCLSIDSITKDTPCKMLEDLFCYPKWEVTEEQEKKMKNGNKLVLNSKEEYLFLTFHGKVVALYKKNHLEYHLVFKVV